MDTNSTAHVCSGATDQEMELYYNMAWWLDGVVQVVMGLVGLLGNSVAIPILLSKKLNRFVEKYTLYCFRNIDHLTDNGTSHLLCRTCSIQNNRLNSISNSTTIFIFCR